MNANEFYTLVRSMREAQKQYFKTRSRDTLIKSKQLEAAADKEIKRYFDDEAEHYRQQPNIQEVK